ncbi:hypothetical protein TWF506_008258 [Arthrobotrys conoides]|uniref:Uncharacterized protein n=1 Tax=Arthrobotrys conoides TaxID=74498 RepID=A0AAN8PFF7_9PEZI
MGYQNGSQRDSARSRPSQFSNPPGHLNTPPRDAFTYKASHSANRRSYSEGNYLYGRGEQPVKVSENLKSQTLMDMSHSTDIMGVLNSLQSPNCGQMYPAPYAATLSMDPGACPKYSMVHSESQREVGYQDLDEFFPEDDDISIHSRVEDMDLGQVFQDFESIFSRAHDWCRQYTPHTSPSLGWWSNNMDGVLELPGVLVSNSKTPLEFDELKNYTIDQLGRAYLCSKIVDCLFTDPESNQYLPLNNDPSFELKDLWAEKHTAKYLACLEAEMRALNAGRPHTLAKVERWRSQTVTLLNPAVGDSRPTLGSREKIFAEGLFRRYVQLIGIGHTTTNHTAAREEFELMISQAIKVSRQLRQHHWKYIVKYPPSFDSGHKYSALKNSGKAKGFHECWVPQILNGQIEFPRGPIKYNPNEDRVWIVDRPLLLSLSPDSKGKGQEILSTRVQARLLVASQQSIIY